MGGHDDRTKTGIGGTDVLSLYLLRGIQALEVGLKLVFVVMYETFNRTLLHLVVGLDKDLSDFVARGFWTIDAFVHLRLYGLRW